MTEDEDRMRVVDLLGAQLSARAIAYLGDDRCAPESTVEHLRSMLLERGLPVFEKVLEYHRIFGGVTDAIEAREATSSGTVRLNGERLIRYQGRPLLPLGPPALEEYWMDEKGTEYLVDQDVDYCEPWSSSVVHTLEKSPFFQEIRRSFPSPLSMYRRRNYRLSLAGHHGERLAGTLALERFEPACDAYGDFWTDDTRLLVENRLRGRDERTYLHAADLDDIVQAVQAVNAVDPLATGQLEGEDPGAGQPGDPIVARLLRRGGAPFPGEIIKEEIVFVGAPGRYGAVTRPLAQPVSLPRRAT